LNTEEIIEIKEIKIGPKALSNELWENDCNLKSHNQMEEDIDAFFQYVYGRNDLEYLSYRLN
jgi:hypothetical protein